MPHPLESGTIRILKQDGSTAGTGFIVSKRLAVTCAHVVESAGVKPDEMINFKYHLGNLNIQTAIVLGKGWSKENDIAVLELCEQLPKWVRPIIMQSSRAMEGRAFQGLGYPDDGPVQTRWPQGNISGCVPVDEYANPLLQLQGKEIDKGLSGSAVVDRITRRVVGMITAYQDIRRSTDNEKVRFGYAIPIETFWMIYPDLEKELPPIPKRSPLVDGIHLLPYGYDFRIQNFLAEYLGTREQPEPFGGRENALKQLDKWLDGDTQRLLLAAPAGRGKSALLVRWLDRLTCRDDLAIAFVPVSVRFRTNLSSAVFASLGARLAYLLGEDVPTSETTSTDVWHGLVSAYLAKPLVDGKKILIVLDGLDEAGDWDASVDLIPAELSKNVRVVVSARYLAGESDASPWLSRLGWEHSGKASILDLSPLDNKGISEVLFRMGVPLDKVSQRVDIVHELHRLSQGDPLLVNLYVEDLWSRGEDVARIHPKELGTIMPGYEGYFDHWWADQKKLWGNEAPLKEKSVRLAFNLLCGAFGGLTIDDFSSLDTEHELNSYAMEDALDALKRFVIGVPNERKEKHVAYVLSHSKLRDYFWEKLSKQDQLDMEARFLSWGEQVLREFIDGKRNPREKVEIPIYIVRNYGVHLARAKQPIEKHLPLIQHQQWAQAWLTVEGSYGGYLQDVQRVQQQCKALDSQSIEDIGKAPYLAEQIRCALIEASIHSLAGNIPPELFWPLLRDGLWTWSQTWVFIRQMSDAKKQSAAIVELAPHLADENLPDALAVSLTIKDEDQRALAISSLLPRLPEIRQQAIETARAIPSTQKWERAKTFGMLVKQLPELEIDFIKAVQANLNDEISKLFVFHFAQYLSKEQILRILEITQNSTLETNRAIGLAVLTQYEPNLVNEVLAIVQRQQDRDGADIMISLAKYAPEEQLRQVRCAAQAINNIWERARVMIALTSRMPALADESLELLKHARRMMWNDIEFADELGNLIRYLPESLLKNGLAEAQTIAYKDGRIKVLGLLAQRLPQVTQLALDATQSIHDEGDHASILYTLTQYLPEIVMDVLNTARATTERLVQISVMSKLSKYLPEAAFEAINSAKMAEHSTMYGSAIGILVEHLPDEHLSSVLSLTSSINDETMRAIELCKLIKRVPDKQLIDILLLARAMPRNSNRATVLIELIPRMPTIVDEALETARASNMLIPLVEYLPEIASDALEHALTIEWEVMRSDQLCKLVDHMPETKLVKILDATRRFEDIEAKAYVLSVLVKRMPEIADEALSVAWMIENAANRAPVLANLTQCMPEMAHYALDAFSEEINQFYVQPLEIIIPYLAKEEFEKVIDATHKMDDKHSRYTILSILTNSLEKLTAQECYGMVFEAALSRFTQRNRANLFSDVSALMPFIIHLGVNNTPYKIYEAVRDVTTWWP